MDQDGGGKCDAVRSRADKVPKEQPSKTRIVTEAGDVIWGTPVKNERTRSGLEMIIDGVGYLPHWATCPQAKQFHGGKSNG